MALLGVSNTALWYLTRSTGAVALILLTISVALGIANVERLQAAGWPRFVIEGVHRNVSLLAIAVLVVHVATSVLDPFAGIHLIDAVIPFTGTYRPVWLGLGAFASDLLLAIALTSVLRRHLSYPLWRVTHWLAYLCWPIAILHTVGTGSDVRQLWLQAILAACGVTVVAAVWFRIANGWPARRGIRTSAALASVALPAALLIWLPSGPLGTGWASRAGTPAQKLAAASTTSGSPSPFSARFDGTAVEQEAGGGRVEVRIALQLADATLDALSLQIVGNPAAGGGVQMTSSTVTLGSTAAPALYTGTITSLAGTDIDARVSSANGTALTLAVTLAIDAGAASGTVEVAPA
jgi:sulfoxide reductase heme-binding subunit YedZ